MKILIQDKFIRNKADVNLKRFLLNTGDAYLEEGNDYRDRSWGTVAGEGRNELSKILTEVRSMLSEGSI